MAAYQQRVAPYYNFYVRSKKFKARVLVLCRVEVFEPTEHEKLSPNWEAPYQVEKVIRSETYHLKQLDGTPLPRL